MKFQQMHLFFLKLDVISLNNESNFSIKDIIKDDKLFLTDLNNNNENLGNRDEIKYNDINGNKIKNIINKKNIKLDNENSNDEKENSDLEKENNDEEKENSDEENEDNINKNIFKLKKKFNIIKNEFTDIISFLLENENEIMENIESIYKEKVNKFIEKYRHFIGIERFSIPVIGEISSGKSTFLNYFLKLNGILQTNDNITTKFICIIRHNKKLKYPKLYKVKVEKRNKDEDWINKPNFIKGELLEDEEGSNIKVLIAKRNKHIMETNSRLMSDYFLILETNIPFFKVRQIIYFLIFMIVIKYFNLLCFFSFCKYFSFFRCNFFYVNIIFIINFYFKI